MLPSYASRIVFKGVGAVGTVSIGTEQLRISEVIPELNRLIGSSPGG